MTSSNKPVPHNKHRPHDHAKKAKALYKERVDKLVAAIRGYDPGFKRADLERALTLMGSMPKNWKGAKDLNNRISEPLDVLEILVNFEKPDRDTILAAILYTSLVPKKDNWVDREQLRKIEDAFGARVRHIVEDTLSLWSLHRLPAATQSPKENLRDFKLMGLLVARSRSAVIIRAANAYNNMHAFASSSREESAQALAWAEVIADLAYLAKSPNLRNAIMNESFRIRNPQKYAEIGRHTWTARILDETGNKIATTTRQSETGGDPIVEETKVKLTDEDIESIRQQIAEAVSHELGGDHNYTQDVRDKEPFSTFDKTGRKDQSFEQLGDIWGARTVLKQTYIDEHFPLNPQRQEKRREKKKAASAETSEENTKPSTPERSACEILYQTMSKKFGRRAPDALRRSLYQELIVKDPHDKEPGKDGRFDNYYENPKPSGYVGIQDTFFFVVKDASTGIQKIVEIEWQFVAENDHKNNTEGKPSHRMFKTDMLGHGDILKAWEECSTTIIDHEGRRPRVPFAAVFMPNNDIVIVPGRADDGCRGTTFITHHIERLREIYRDADITSPQDIVALHIDNSNPLMGRDPDVNLSPLERLRSGDRIVGVELKSRLADGPG